VTPWPRVAEIERRSRGNRHIPRYYTWREAAELRLTPEKLSLLLSRAIIPIMIRRLRLFLVAHNMNHNYCFVIGNAFPLIYTSRYRSADPVVRFGFIKAFSSSRLDDLSLFHLFSR
jgi:hypothetical protein